MSIFTEYFSQTSLATCLLSLSLCTAIPYNTSYASQQEALENLRERIAEMQREIEKTTETKSEAFDSLQESEQAISNLNRKLVELNTKLRSADHKLNKLQTQLQELNSSMSGQHALLGNLLNQQYLGGRQEYLKLLLNNQNPNRVARDLQYYHYIARSRSTWLASMRADFAKLNIVSTSVRTQRLELAELRSEQSAQKDSLEKQQRARQKLLLRVSKQLRQQHLEINRLQHDENRLAQLVEKITEMLAEPVTTSTLSNEKLPDERFDSTPFDKLRGKLTLPVKGEITNRFGTKRPDSTVLWKGLFVRTPSGQAVKSVAAGRVVFADWLRGFGNLLIIDHGKGYMSLYGNNESLHKQVGEVIRGGDTIAVVGNSGGNEISGLYFELRHKSKPLDPTKWLTIRRPFQ